MYLKGKKLKRGSFFIKAGLIIFMLLSSVSLSLAHDGWIQTNVSRVVLGDMVYIDMQFGNHQNTHRDYRIYASKWDATKATFGLHVPSGAIVDLKDRVIDVGMDEAKTVNGAPYVDRNGYLVASFQPDRKGFYIGDVRQDVVVSYAPERSIKCAKTIVAALPSSMGNYGLSMQGYDRVLGQVLEIIPMNDPTKLAVGDTLTVKVLFKGEPLTDAHFHVIPRGKTLPPFGEPNPNDLMTDMDGMVSFTFDEANYHLLVVHVETDEAGTLGDKPYSFTKYTGDLTVIVRPGR